MKHIMAAALAFFAGTAHADDFNAAMQDYLETEMRAWMNDPVLVSAIKDQNAVTAGYDQAEIDTLDETWRAYAGMDDAPIITAVIDNPAAAFLRERVSASGGVMTEAFVMDAKGLNVAASEPTSDYWQGDEAKFTQTYPIGPDATHLGDVELDASTQEVQGQISVTITDPTTGQAVGALTVGVSLTELTMAAG
ncbi:hypothetical protein [Yoonia litorea]|uniref:Uncharacterized protein n=1 Tax=Yoonia litorea TaxID=1123755 RepID=A0A1I6LWU9_9RHOB|nr:hypothetical protein [Yoonia litorea]SFS07762.1 hypothetical protein SAMN05444714_0962 [Yoonia litorea]